MADSDRQPNDGWDANDLPLNSIPTAREPRRPTPRAARERDLDGGFGKYVIAVAVVFGLIIAVAIIAAPYVRVPGETTAATTAAPVVNPAAASTSTRQRVESVPAPIVEPTPAVVTEAWPEATVATETIAATTPAAEVMTEPAATEPAAVVPPPIEPAPTTVEANPPASSVEPAMANVPSPDPAREQRVAELERELAQRTAALAEARAGQDDARKRLREAERATDKRVATSQGDLKKQHAAEVQALQVQLTEAAKARDEVSAGSAKRIAELEKRLAAADQRITTAEGTVQAGNTAHAAQLEGESKAVRSLLGDLTRARDELAAEKKARTKAEQRVRALESQSATAAGNASAAPAPAPGKVVATSTQSGSTPPTVEASVPERITTVPPRYPPELRQTGIGGRVLLRLLVDELGNVSDIETGTSPHPQLTSAATRAARQWKYNPARRNGLRVKMWVNEAVDFQI